MRVTEEIINQLKELGIKNTADIYFNLGSPALYEQAIRRRE